MKVEDIISEIRKQRLDQINQNNVKRIYDTKSSRDEIRVMQGMMNDTTYQVNVYQGNNITGIYNPAVTFRNMFSSVLSEMTGMNKIETNEIVKNYTFDQKSASTMVDFSKEFINTYLKTERKIPLGGRDKSNIALKSKTIPAGFIKYPVKITENNDGKVVCESKQAYVPEYKSVKIFAPCPIWLKDKSNE